MDANFKLKQKDRGFLDPPLSNGFAYMVSNETLLAHLAQCKDDKILKADVSPHCPMEVYHPLTYSVRPQLVALPSMPSPTHIRSVPLAMPSQVLEVSIVPAMDSNDLPEWWTCRKGNGTSLHLFRKLILMPNQLR